MISLKAMVHFEIQRQYYVILDNRMIKSLPRPTQSPCSRLGR